jgi:hypothetical protein
MSEYPRKVQSRRELFAGALRYATLGLLTAGGAALYAKRRRLVQQGVCIGDGVCAGCNIFEQCSLPAALSVKKVLVGVSRGGR